MSRRATPAGSRSARRTASACDSQHLAAMGRRHDARRAVQHAAEEIVVASLDDAGMQSAACAQRDAVRPAAGSASARWNATTAASASLGSSKAAHMPSPVILTTLPRCPLHRGARQRVMPRERGFHARRLALPQLRAALDIGEEEGRDRGMIVHAWDPGAAADAGRLLYGRASSAASGRDATSRTHNSSQLRSHVGFR